MLRISIWRASDGKLYATVVREGSKVVWQIERGVPIQDVAGNLATPDLPSDEERRAIRIAYAYSGKQ
jgi:hypothetical protein